MRAANEECRRWQGDVRGRKECSVGLVFRAAKEDGDGSSQSDGGDQHRKPVNLALLFCSSLTLSPRSKPEKNSRKGDRRGGRRNKTKRPAISTIGCGSTTPTDSPNKQRALAIGREWTGQRHSQVFRQKVDPPKCRQIPCRQGNRREEHLPPLHSLLPHHQPYPQLDRNPPCSPTFAQRPIGRLGRRNKTRSQLHRTRDPSRRVTPLLPTETFHEADSGLAASATVAGDGLSGRVGYGRISQRGALFVFPACGLISRRASPYTMMEDDVVDRHGLHDARRPRNFPPPGSLV